MTESAGEPVEPVKNAPDASSAAAPVPESNKPSAEEEAKARKIASLNARNTELEAEIAAMKAKLEEVSKELKHPAKATVANHIAHLHTYNEIRDIGQGLLGLVADARNVRASEVYEEFGVGTKD